MKRTSQGFFLLFASLFLLGALFAVNGCAGGQVGAGNVVEHVTQAEPLYRAAVQLGVLKVLEKNPKLAPRVKEIAGHAAADVAAGEVVPLAVLEAQVREAIHWEELKPEEAVLVDALVLTVRQELERATAGIQAPEEVRLLVAKVLGWVSEAAALRA